MRDSFRFCLLLVAVSVIASGCSLTGRSVDPTIAAPPFKWGFIGPLSGPASVYGVPALNAARMAVDEINSKGGIDGRKIDLIVEDGKCDGATAVTAAQKLISVDNVYVIIGGHCSTESMSILPVAQTNNVFVVSSITSTPAFTGKGRFAFRMSPSSTYYNGAQADVAFSKGLRKVAILHEQRDFSAGLAQAFTKRFEELGGEVVITESFLPETMDFRTQLEKIRAVEPDALLVSTQMPATASVMLKQIKEMRLEIPLIGDAAVVSLSTYNLSAGALPDDAWSVTPHVDGSENDVASRFASEYRRQFGEPKVELSFAAENYDAVYLLSDAISSCGQNNECIRGFFMATKHRPSALGDFSIGPDGDPVYSLSMVRIINGTAVYQKVR
ncbi:MAG: ABC transporter substrate-binding protein [Nanoarchaeota archaeon]